MKFPTRLGLLVLLAFLLAVTLPAADPPTVEQITDWAIISGDNQAVAPGVPFGVIARYTGAPPVDGREVGLRRVLTGGPSIQCTPNFTDAQGFVSIACIAGFWTVETQVRITLGDELGGVLPDFVVTVRPPFIAEGLTIIGPERRTAIRGEAFDLTVQAARFGQPLEDRRLTIERNPSTIPLSCPEVVFTDSIGQATITCRSLDILEESAVVLVSFTDDEGNSVTFTVTLLAIDQLVDGIFKISGDDQAAPEGTPLARPMVVQVIIDGRPAGGVELDIKVSDPNLVFCPIEVESGPDGLAYIQCASGLIQDQGIQSNGFALVEVEDRQRRFLREEFRVSVIKEDLNIVANFELVSDDDIIVFAGNTINTLFWIVPLLALAVVKLLTQPAELHRMQMNALKLGRPNSAADAARAALGLLSV